ncbi:MAG: helix-turn-helix transcriptional regulator [Planctomycetaceae bacterium]|nr:helix-turn-helix transcriptional regulator [Planctomycetaceae bacterium]
MSSVSTKPEAIGQRLRWAREQAGLSQGQVAQMFEYHRPTISQIEAGKRIVRPDEIERFAEIYGVKDAWILRGEAVFDDESDPRIELAARELAKLRQEDLDAILRLIKIMRAQGSGTSE